MGKKRKKEIKELARQGEFLRAELIKLIDAVIAVQEMLNRFPDPYDLPQPVPQHAVTQKPGQNLHDALQEAQAREPLIVAGKVRTRRGLVSAMQEILGDQPVPLDEAAKLVARRYHGTRGGTLRISEARRKLMRAVRSGEFRYAQPSEMM